MALAKKVFCQGTKLFFKQAQQKVCHSWARSFDRSICKDITKYIINNSHFYFSSKINKNVRVNHQDCFLVSVFMHSFFSHSYIRNFQTPNINKKDIVSVVERALLA